MHASPFTDRPCAERAAQGPGPKDRRAKPGLRSFLAEQRGALAPVVALFMPMAVGAAGLAVDVSNSYVEQNRLQTAVDEAALVAVQALPDVEAARAAAISTFDKHYNTMRPTVDDPDQDQDRVEPSDISFGRWDPATRSVTAGDADDADDAAPNAIAMTVRRDAAAGRGVDTWFLAAFGIKQFDLTASAVAQYQGGGFGTCILALEPTAGAAVHVQGNADLLASGCRIQVNSTAGNAIRVTGGAGTIAAEEICVAGGAQNSSRMSPAPETGCATMPDPLAHFTPPSIGTCNHFGHSVGGGGGTTLQPGVYCGGLSIKGPGPVTMAPGIYVMKDGPFAANGNVQINGDGVAIHLAGTGALMDIQGPVKLDLVAPSSGPLAGFAIYQNPNVPSGLVSKMGQGNSQTRLEGPVYLPDQHLTWGGTPGTTLPPWTLLVARTVYVFGTAELRVDSDFEASDAPAPNGFSEKKSVRLVN